MKWLDALGVAVSIIFGISIGLLIADTAKGGLLSEGAITVLWAGITGISGAALGAGIGVFGALHAARQQIEANRHENRRRDRAASLKAELAEKSGVLEVLADFEAVLMPLAASIEIVKKQSEKIKKNLEKEVTSHFALTTLLHQIDNALEAELPISKVHGPEIRREWVLICYGVRHIRPGLEEICQTDDLGVHDNFVNHIAETALLPLDKRCDRVIELTKERERILYEELSKFRMDLNGMYEV